MTALDQEIGDLIIRADLNHRLASRWTRLRVWLFGRHRSVQHIGYVARIAVWRGHPYLLTFREA